MFRVSYYIILVFVIQLHSKICLSSSTEDNICSIPEFTCTSGKVKCVTQDQVCDGVENCEDSSDEHHCHTCGIPHGAWFYCGNDPKDCIAARWECDGEQDCEDGSDELNCDSASSQNNGCSSSEFQCSNGMCIPIIWHCDGHYDCMDKSDEEKCKRNVTEKNNPQLPRSNANNASAGISHRGLIPRASTCVEDGFKCSSDDCIRRKWVCDGTADCPDGDDEYDCNGRGLDVNKTTEIVSNSTEPYQQTTPLLRTANDSYQQESSRISRIVNINTQEINSSSIKSHHNVTTQKSNQLICDNGISWPLEAMIIIGINIILVLALIMLLLFVAIKFGFLKCLTSCLRKNAETQHIEMTWKDLEHDLASMNSSQTIILSCDD